MSASRPRIEAHEEIARARVTTRERLGVLRWHEDDPVICAQQILRVFYFTVSLVAILEAKTRAFTAQRPRQLELLEAWIDWMVDQDLNTMEIVACAPNLGVAKLTLMARFGAQYPSEIPRHKTIETAVTASGEI